MAVVTQEKNGGFIKNAWRALASMRLFCILAFAIAAWFTAALFLYPKYSVLFREIDRNVLFHWLFASSPFGDPVRIWLLGLIALVAILGLNLAACVADDFTSLSRMLKKRNGSSRAAISKLTILLVHISYVLILSGHLITAVSGYRISVAAEPGKIIGGPQIPFTMRCVKANVFEGMKGTKGLRGRLMAKGVVVVNSGAVNEKKIFLKPGKTVWYGGVMIDMEARMNKNIAAGNTTAPFSPADATPSVRLTKNYGLYFDAVGGLLFFIGIVMRMIFRKEQSIKGA
jgi:hypothetical protein